MAIELVTGLPGHGKTLMTIARYRDVAKSSGRQIFHAGIKGLKLPWPAWDPKRWQELEPGSILIVDEAQFVFPVRGRGQPEPWIEQLAVHRHGGLDLVLITQNPMLIDSFVRRLVDRHWHVVRKFGTHSVTLHEFPNGCKENVAASREGSVRHDFRYPKDVFEVYESAEAHTVKRRIPARVFILLSIPFILAGLAWFGYSRLKPDAVAARMGVPAPVESSHGIGSGPPPAGRVGPATAGEYVADFQPRIADLAHTAPAYDQVTKPVAAPHPAACVASANVCKCYTDQATLLQMGDKLCRDIVAGGFFVPWMSSAARQAQGFVRAAPVPVSSGGSVAVGIGASVQPSSAFPDKQTDLPERGGRPRAGAHPS